MYNSFAASLSLDDIYDEVIKKEGGIGMNLERVRASLEQLGCQIPVMEIDKTYSIGIVLTYFYFSGQEEQNFVRIPVF